jgi:hypothetical protein
MVPKVYIVQDTGHLNFIPAEHYGELIACIDGRVSHVGMPRAFSRLQKSLSRISADDWLVPTGHPALIAYAGHLMASRAGVIRILSWDNQTSTYIPSQIEVATQK